jgi:hypothetical protein
MTDFIHPEKPFREWIERLKAKLNAELAPGVRKFVIPDLLAMSENSDPFWAGKPREIKLAKWFKKIWFEGLGNFGDHLRRIHYALLSRLTKNAYGKTYENSKADWDALNEASRQARHLQMVGADQFVDRKNPEAIVPAWVTQPTADPPEVVLPNPPDFKMPQIWMSSGQIEFPGYPGVDGYSDDDHLDRAVYLSLWVEKSTQNDILQPLCEELGMELVTLSGRSSITSCIQFLLRLQKLKKRGRIFYVSDYDPSGKNMPMEVAREQRRLLAQSVETETRTGTDVRESSQRRR